jgi:hypothetical protein
MDRWSGIFRILDPGFESHLRGGCIILFCLWHLVFSREASLSVLGRSFVGPHKRCATSIHSEPIPHIFKTVELRLKETKVEVYGWSETPRKVFCVWNWVSFAHTYSLSVSNWLRRAKRDVFFSSDILHLHAWKNLLNYRLRIILLTLLLVIYNSSGCAVRFSSWLLSPVKNKAIRTTSALLFAH